MRKIGRRCHIEQLVELREMRTEQALEIAHRLRRVVIAEPPEPVGALADGQLQARTLCLIRRKSIRGERAIEYLLGFDQHVPAAVLVGTADPGGQRSVHPAPGNQRRQLHGSGPVIAQKVAERAQLQVRVHSKFAVQGWLEAIKTDGLIWKHISDLKQWDSEAQKLYQIEGIPYNVLVDPQGKIIAANLHREELDEKLAEVLK